MKELLLCFSLSVMNAQETVSPDNWPDRTVLLIEGYQRVGKLGSAIKDSDKIESPSEIKSAI